MLEIGQNRTGVITPSGMAIVGQLDATRPSISRSRRSAARLVGLHGLRLNVEQVIARSTADISEQIQFLFLS
jgi:hypothetical protein